MPTQRRNGAPGVSFLQFGIFWQHIPAIHYAFGSFKNDFQKDPDLLRLNELDEFPLMRLSAKCLIQQQRFQSQKVLFGRFLETLWS